MIWYGVTETESALNQHNTTTMKRNISMQGDDDNADLEFEQVGNSSDETAIISIEGEELSSEELVFEKLQNALRQAEKEAADIEKKNKKRERREGHERHGDDEGQRNT